ncbi:protein DEFECTIVE IN MERISTEM SILENCING 3-like isoform X1 [Papaver somniferum]|uniref:protein DEFECTIVE IN MERISTEM SILENCING 3-like isoform X1 n=1 Tax=Papaver somniferum TaxID=3469 RepID=UPI000E70536E|nr:protein DEFECTIVE IN MERISTEM SILENCING 3-like isoform X1 [Papaver somniferum]
MYTPNLHHHPIHVHVAPLQVQDPSSMDFNNSVSPGGGVYMQNASPRVAGAAFMQNVAPAAFMQNVTPGVGGVHMQNASPGAGGAAFMQNASPGAEGAAYMQNGNFSKPGTVVDITKRLQDELAKIGLKIKTHEENLKFLKKETDNVDESILDLQVTLGKHRSENESSAGNDDSTHIQTEENTVQQILKQEKSAAGVICQLKTHHATQASNLPLTKDVLGIVATLGHVDDDNLSRLLSEFLGLEKIMAIVCMTYEGVKSIESYEKEGKISKGSGIHGLGASIAKPVDGRFEVICLEGLRPYVGDIVSDDPQRKLALMKPRLPNGECPPGFLGFAVNMINLDHSYLSYVTATGHGLRETLFYSLFSRLQVYRTRAEMLLALPFICDGAMSLDGGMIRSAGMLVLGDRKDVEVRFPLTSPTKKMALNYLDTEEKLKLKKWEKERILDDVQREQQLLFHVKQSFESKRQEFVKNLAESSSYITQQQFQSGSRSSTPR